MKKFEEFKEFIKEQEVFTNMSDGGDFWGTIGAGILPISRESKRILLPLRSNDVNEPNTWGVWGGKLDDMETNDPKEAARIEFKEESGYSGKIEMIPSYVFNKKNNEGKVVFTYHNYIGILDKEFEPMLDWETQDFKWVTFEEMMKINPKHFGLNSLLKNKLSQIMKVIKNL